MDTGGDFILYDGECPFCRSYIALATLRRAVPALRVLNAREHPDLVARLRMQGYEINEGMVVFYRGAYHYAADATRLLAEIAPPGGRLRRGTLDLIGRGPWSARLYPLLNRGRKFWLRLQGTPLIGQAQAPKPD